MSLKWISGSISNAVETRIPQIKSYLVALRLLDHVATDFLRGTGIRLLGKHFSVILLTFESFATKKVYVKKFKFFTVLKSDSMTAQIQSQP